MNIFEQAANNYNTGASGIQNAMNPMASIMSMNQFANPYREMVLDAAMARSQHNLGEDLNMVRGQAAMGGAYGGARHALLEAQVIEDATMADNELIARILQDGFDTTANLGIANTNIGLNASSALTNAASAGYGMGASALAQQRSAGNQVQALNQSILDRVNTGITNYANYPQTSLATAIAGLQGNPLAAATTTTQTYNPGMMDFLSLGFGLFGAGK